MKAVRTGEVVQADVIASLMRAYPEMKIKGWRVASTTAFSQELTEGGEDTSGDGQAVLDKLNLIPDIYVIDTDERELHFFEVEVRHLLTANKLQRYAVFKTDLHSYGIGFRLFMVNKHGHVNEIDLFGHYLERVLRLS